MIRTALLLAALLSARSALAFDCVDPAKTAKQAFRRANAVFIGTVLPDYYGQEAIFHVLRSYKGNVSDRQYVSTLYGYFAEGVTYLVFAHGSGDQLSVSVCNDLPYTQPLICARPILRELAIKPPPIPDRDPYPLFQCIRAPVLEVETYDAQKPFRRFQATIGRDGRVRDIKHIVTVTGEERQRIAASLEQWQFEPAVLDGKPVAVFVDDAWLAEQVFRLRAKRRAL